VVGAHQGCQRLGEDLYPGSEVGVEAALGHHLDLAPVHVHRVLGDQHGGRGLDGETANEGRPGRDASQDAAGVIGTPTHAPVGTPGEVVVELGGAQVRCGDTGAHLVRLDARDVQDGVSDVRLESPEPWGPDASGEP